MRETKKIKEEIQKWRENNGACTVDVKEENVIFCNGGLWQECDEDGSEMWIGDLDSTIRYMRRLQRLLKRLGFDTNRNLH